MFASFALAIPPALSYTFLHKPSGVQISKISACPMIHSTQVPQEANAQKAKLRQPIGKPIELAKARIHRTGETEST